MSQDIPVKLPASHHEVFPELVTEPKQVLHVHHCSQRHMLWLTLSQVTSPTSGKVNLELCYLY